MTQEAYRVSVIVPNYNYSDTLRMCIRAIQAQTYKPMEIIIADDCSTDDSVQVAESMGVRVLSTGVNSGQAVARNIGAENARGDVLFFVDSDLVLDPDAIAQAVSILDADRKIGAVCGVNSPHPLIPNRMIKKYRSLQYHYWSLTPDETVSFLFSAMFAIRAETFAEIGPFNASLRWSEEVEYGYRLCRAYRICLTTAVRGLHDSDSSMSGLLRKLFHRGRARIPLYAKEHGFAHGFETPSRSWASIAAFLAVLALGLPVAFGWAWLAVTGALLAASIIADAGMYRFVAAERGILFLVYYVGIHFMVNLTIAVAVIAGIIQWIFSARFRRMYDGIEGAMQPPAASA